MTHQLSEKEDGTGNMSTITPTCSCGWVGYPVAAYNDDQLFRVREQGEDHINNPDRGQPKPLYAAGQLVHQGTD